MSANPSSTRSTFPSCGRPRSRSACTRVRAKRQSWQAKKDQSEFDTRGWCHPYDQRGGRCGFADIPKSVADLRDDPFRSLAGELRKAGGFAKDTTPFSEFLWADYLRRRIKRATVKRDFDSALGEAMKLAKSQDTHFLPGWCGPLV